MFAFSEDCQESTVKCLDGSSGIVGNGRTQSSLVFGNLRQSLRILGSLRKSSAIIRNCLNMAKNSALYTKQNNIGLFGAVESGKNAVSKNLLLLVLKCL